MEYKFLKIFDTTKPVMGMLHLKGENEKEALKKAYEETEIMVDNGVSAVIVENYFGKYEYVEYVLHDFCRNNVKFIYGMNLLGDDENSFTLAQKYGASFLQLDSVAGHLTPEDDVKFEKRIMSWRKNYDGAVIGGVRFKYQPYLSGRSLEEDLKIGMSRCDAIAVTGEGTGLPTEVSKLLEFRNIVGDFPIVVAAGVTPDSCKAQFEVADAAIIGSYFKDTYKDTGDVCRKHVVEMMNAVNKCR